MSVHVGNNDELEHIHNTVSSASTCPVPHTIQCFNPSAAIVCGNRIDRVCSEGTSFRVVSHIDMRRVLKTKQPTKLIKKLTSYTFVVVRVPGSISGIVNNLMPSCIRER